MVIILIGVWFACFQSILYDSRQAVDWNLTMCRSWKPCTPLLVSWIFVHWNKRTRIHNSNRLKHSTHLVGFLENWKNSLTPRHTRKMWAWRKEGRSVLSYGMLNIEKTTTLNSSTSSAKNGEFLGIKFQLETSNSQKIRASQWWSLRHQFLVSLLVLKRDCKNPYVTCVKKASPCPFLKRRTFNEITMTLFFGVREN